MDQWLALLRKGLERNYDRLDAVLAAMEHKKQLGGKNAMGKMTLKVEGDRYIVVTRRFAAPPEAVYRAHTEPQLIQQWMVGPDGWTMPVCISDARPGGKIRYEWTNGKGGGFHLTGEYLELEPFRRIVHVERMHLPDPTPDNHVETKFDPEAAGTLRTMRMTLPDAQTRAAMLCFRHGAWNGSELRSAGKHALDAARDLGAPNDTPVFVALR